MTTPFYCLVLALLLMYLPKAVMLGYLLVNKKPYNHKQPRAQQATMEGVLARSVAAHKNAFEAFPQFAAAVIVAHILGADPHRSAVLAMAYLVARVFYHVAYLLDLEYLRTLVWFVGWAATLGLFYLGWAAT